MYFAQKMVSKLFILQVFVLLSLILPAKAYPAQSSDAMKKILLRILSAKTYPLQPSDTLKKYLSRMDAPKQQSENYAEKMADDRRVNLENCRNIICMPHYLCINDLVVTNLTKLFEIRMQTRVNVDTESKRIVCEYMEMPCCADKAIKNLHLDDNQPIEDDSNERNDYDKDDEVDILHEIKSVEKCGYRKKETISTRIIGEQAEPNEFPWMVAIFNRLPSGDLKYIGGGSLIHESVILTAAHKVDQQRYKPEQLVIRAGEHDILKTIKSVKSQEQNATNIIVHEHFDRQFFTLINDIALVVLEKPFKLTDAVNTICLPPQGIQTKTNVMCTSGGWGKDGPNHHGKYQKTLQKAQLPIVRKGRCERLLRRTRLGKYFNLDESLMCAGGKESDTCKGDGGSPLFCEIPQDEGRFYQTGIVAGGMECGKKVPGLYVDVSHFTNWIRRELRFNDFNLEQQNILQYELFD